MANNINFDDISSHNVVVKKSNKSKKLKKAFGKGEMNMAAIPQKVSNVKISRIFNAEERGGCTRCFPHGFETTNATVKKNKRSWKNRRKKQYKSSLK